MTKTSKKTPPPPKNAEEVVEWFLQLVMKHPEKLPKQQYRQRENAAQIMGYNQAQEDLRHALTQVVGKTKQAGRARELAEVRAEGQQRPIRFGNKRGWVIG